MTMENVLMMRKVMVVLRLVLVMILQVLIQHYWYFNGTTGTESILILTRRGPGRSGLHTCSSGVPNFTLEYN